MAAKNSDPVPSVPVPPVPVPPVADAVPPIEATPVVAPAEPAPAVPAVPAVPVVESAPVTPPPTSPYGAPAATQPPAAEYAPPVPPVYGQPASPYAQQAYSPAGAGAPQGLSIASMITGIAGVLLSFAALGFLPALAAVILGHIAQKRQPAAKAMWLTGIITGYVGLGISLISGLVVLIAIIAGFSAVSYLG